MDKLIDSSKITELATQWAYSIILSVIALIIGLWIIKKLTSVMRNTINKSQIDPSVLKFMVSIISVLLKILLALTIAGILGIKTTSFIAIFGAAAFAIGTALSGSLSHFASGVMLMIFKPYKVGDLVKLGDHTGTVEEVQIFNTVLRTFENKVIYIPNAIVTGSPIINISGQGTMRCDLFISIGGNESIDKARTVILEVLNLNHYVNKSPAPSVNVKSLTPIAIDFDIHPWIQSMDYWAAYYSITEQIKKALIINQIAGPKPGMDVQVFQNSL